MRAGVHRTQLEDSFRIDRNNGLHFKDIHVQWVCAVQEASYTFSFNRDAARHTHNIEERSGPVTA